ncbi:hypothetical protein AVEN_47990-1 [Araneus ventricosus]|uniref:Uncharacterized protein n=1 Tax=Araneus ventricosus TaxID=182803 RepID=A0A4Y2AAB6_ARAVE|nr:hypothetical protein AVEN_47990-1 [Araneus ventricosus]
MRLIHVTSQSRSKHNCACEGRGGPRPGQTGQLPIAPNSGWCQSWNVKGRKKWFNWHESSVENGKKIFFQFGAPSPVFRTGAQLKPLDPGGVSNLFHEHQAIKVGGSFTGRTEQIAPMGNQILGDRIDSRCGPVDCAPTSPRFQKEPSLP